MLRLTDEGTGGERGEVVEGIGCEGSLLIAASFDGFAVEVLSSGLGATCVPFGCSFSIP